MTTGLSEALVEKAALAWLESVGYDIIHGPDLAIGGRYAERTDNAFRDTVLAERLRDALAHLNPDLPTDALADAFTQLTTAAAGSLIDRNRRLHRMMTDGVPVETRRADGSIAGVLARVIDFDFPVANDWLAVDQFTVAEGQHVRRPDIVTFLNGLPVGVIELKNPLDESATVWAALNQLHTYQAQVPTLFAYNAVLAISDGLHARIGALGASAEWFKPWRTITGVGEPTGAARAAGAHRRGVRARTLPAAAPPLYAV